MAAVRTDKKGGEYYCQYLSYNCKSSQDCFSSTKQLKHSPLILSVPPPDSHSVKFAFGTQCHSVSHANGTENISVQKLKKRGLVDPSLRCGRDGSLLFLHPGTTTDLHAEIFKRKEVDEREHLPVFN